MHRVRNCGLLGPFSPLPHAALSGGAAPSSFPVCPSLRLLDANMLIGSRTSVPWRPGLFSAATALWRRSGWAWCESSGWGLLSTAAVPCCSALRRFWWRLWPRRSWSCWPLRSAARLCNDQRERRSRSRQPWPAATAQKGRTLCPSIDDLTPRVVQCVHFAKGSCKFGDKCRFLH